MARFYRVTTKFNAKMSISTPDKYPYIRDFPLLDSVNHIDLAHRFAGMLMGVTNSAGTLTGVIGLVIEKAIVHLVSE